MNTFDKFDKEDKEIFENNMKSAESFIREMQYDKAYYAADAALDFALFEHDVSYALGVRKEAKIMAEEAGQKIYIDPDKHISDDEIGVF